MGGLTGTQAAALSEALTVPLSYWHRDTATRELLDLRTVELICRQPNVAVLWRGEGFTRSQERLLRDVAENLRCEEADGEVLPPWG